MTKIRKQRRRKTFRHNVNRKRLRNKLNNVGKIACKEIENVWDRKKSVVTNLEEMGLSYDPNRTITIPNIKAKLKAAASSNTEEWVEENLEVKPTKSFVVESLEEDAKAPRAYMFRLPKGQVEWITYLLDKYGKDYKAMAKDSKNYYQETWKQLRAKIMRFKSISEQYGDYLKSRNLTESDEADDTISDDEL